MRQIYREITPVTPEDFFIIRHHEDADFRYPIHMHPEYELNLVLNVWGSRIVGDSIADFGLEDLVFIGPNIYHSWDQDEESETENRQAEVITIQFSEHLFSQGLLNRKVMRSIRHMFEHSVRGIAFYGETRRMAIAYMRKLANESGFQQVLDFFSLLQLLAVSGEMSYLASEGFSAKPEHTNSKRINEVYKYILDHFTRPISLSEVAEVANMSDSAFSHFFKRSTNKSFTQFVIDLRLGRSAKLLLETQENISQICYACGFNNVSNFNRLFKKHKKLTPYQYRKMYQNPISNPPKRFVLS